jgi:hypothetical protein
MHWQRPLSNGWIIVSLGTVLYQDQDHGTSQKMDVSWGFPDD